MRSRVLPDAEAAFAVASRLHDAVPLIHLEVVSGAVAKTLGYGEQSRVLAGFGGNAQEVAFLIAQASAIIGSGDCDRDRRCAKPLAAYERLRDFAATDAIASARKSRWRRQNLASMPAAMRRGISRACGLAASRKFSPRTSRTRRACGRTVARWREIAHRGRGHLRVLRVDDEVRAGISIFDTPPHAALALMRRLKTAFDPHGIFNPGCFVGGL